MKNNKIKITVIDGYLDEPSCLGVPPYISPHIRYLWGALLEAGISPVNLNYITIDQLRQNQNDELEKMEALDIVILVAGTTVPGHYLGGQPASAAEIKEIGEKIFYPTKVLAGPITLIKKMREKFEADYDILTAEIAALDLYQRLQSAEISTAERNDYINKFAVRGAQVVKKHPNYPHLIAELETFRGCPRASHCSFCSERLKKLTYSRQPEAVSSEVKALAAAGLHHYRLGSQTDLLLYGAQRKSNDFKLNPAQIRELYRGIRKADPELKVLHMDNMNPAEIARNPDQAAEIIEIITKYNTAGDTAAFGLESADPLVLKKNNIDSTAEENYFAIKLMNEIGGKRKDGVPKLLPGLNFLHGLIGERKETLNYNYEFLKKLLQDDLMLRRINIRQVVRLGSYPEVKYSLGEFKKYKEKINQKINQQMLKRVFPTGVILKDLYSEKKKGSLNYCRQLGTYPILTAVIDQNDDFFEQVKVIDHGYRSITALKWPKKVSEYSKKELESIPGIGSKRASRIIFKKPETQSELTQLLGANFESKIFEQFFKF
ncbi:Radical SAM superfamily enzyme with C-terminal helix-hairpin-helix motif [Halanaerobium congolense]|jgi:radical SAM superfamily enzyme with C-terminal helix-hairpin-helix motif|uniref:Radical SAM superfamily enzyme with C-terminal helix-hairpin-helix motif n=1 Tax=Halanaerobium congolense TaxID=54121 RepID=A0A1M7P9C5_9FIRM|nr:radical SAM protein [Halanaerobium congolense]OEG62238.1 MAG: radical SAM protein [Halanaerobium sp. MDAL1]SDI42522.1 Radical SAM superfamily enzyme with C-terminal helix-hairpin-helix motif [Halanaerobium congolense]SET23569.1 Radical SAM superfamily enzyme with C-terminal helix-hairpin-helix motif [Halanaerobium congolense]SHN12838.1 Radical SAM superfamily enzyme with C-terminal helix-hairpin-helix motif [Halanaerobium congolense]